MYDKLTNVPQKPGIYLFKDKNNKTLYVGKAKELRNRLRSYFRKSSVSDARKSAMIRDVSDFEYTVTENELEAFLLEANLIKLHRPRYNILLRDDKNYPYLKLTMNEKWPRLEVARKIQKDRAKYFGPYVPSGAMWNILSFIENNFHIPTCKYSFEKRMRPCIQHQIKRCLAPCAGLVEHSEYLSVVNDIRLLLEGKNNDLLKSLKNKMQVFSGEMRYEDAAVIRDQIRAVQQISDSQKAIAPELGDVDVIGFFRKENSAVFKILFLRKGSMIGSKDFQIKDVSGENNGYLMKNVIGQFYQKEIIPPEEIICLCKPEDSSALSLWLSDRKGSRVKILVPKRGIRKRLLEMAEENAKILHESKFNIDEKAVMREIAKRLNLNKIPETIGAFDISNISGKESAGAFVYWSGGELIKEKYRHIRMDAVKGPDDYSMMKEMIRRTFQKSEVKYENKEREDLVPALIIIDGGRGHLEAALQAIKELGIITETVSIAKDPDRVFLKNKGQCINLDDGKASSLLLKKLRDEAHRFAISYHKKLRSKKIFESPLEKIKGIGKKRRFELLRHFGSIEEIRKAAVEELLKIKGFNKKIAKKVLEELKRN